MGLEAVPFGTFPMIVDRSCFTSFPPVLGHLVFLAGLFTWREGKTLVPAGDGRNNVPLRSQAEISVLVVPQQKNN